MTGNDETPRRAATVLLAEDNAQIRALAARALRSMGLEVLEASDGVSAATLAALHNGPIDLLVTDVAMPRLSGPLLAQRLQAARPGLRVLFISGDTVDLRVPAEVPVVFKPFKLEELENAVRALLPTPRVKVQVSPGK